MRLLTMKFTSFNMAKAERQYKKSIVDFLDIGNLSVEKILQLISIGNNLCDEEKAAERLDNYLSDENNSLVDAYIQLLSELDMDVKLLKRSGISIDDIKAQFESNIATNADKFNAKTDEAETSKTEVSETETNAVEVALKLGETPKVDVNGNATLD